MICSKCRKPIKKGYWIKDKKAKVEQEILICEKCKLKNKQKDLKITKTKND